MAFIRLSALDRLAEGLRRQPHEYRPTLQVFPDLSINILASELDVARKGVERGRQNEPVTESLSFDEIEHLIVERIYSERKAAHQELIDQLETYSRRLNSLDFAGRFAAIQHAAPDAVAEFNAEARQGRDLLFQLRRALRENEQERDAFKKRHRLPRAPRVTSAAGTFLKVAFLIFLFVVETYINGGFLAKGNELGYLGGVLEALVFALLNVIVSFFIALFGARQLNHTGFFRKLSGALAIAAWIAFAVILNLALAHYREISGTLYDDAGRQVIGRVIANPAGLSDIKSWLFFALGLVFSTAAFVDGLYFLDPFPGYGALEKRVQQAHENYIVHKDALVAELKTIREKRVLQMEEVGRDLGKRRGEHDSILDGRARLLSLFDQHQDQLERAADALLAQYRAANRQTRSSPAPTRFEQRWSMDRIHVAAELPQSLVQKNLGEEIKSMQDILNVEIRAIHKAFDDAIESYRQIDDLVPEQMYVGSPSTATRT